MGIVTQGIPKDIVVELARLNGATVFVETGTFHGATARWASDYFDIVHTIERAEGLYTLHGKELAQVKHVTPHLGDSRDILPSIIRGIGDRRAVYWLDGHWSGGETAGESDECPLLDELACVSSRTEDIILIDDARYFLCAPPPPYNPSQWPTIPAILNALAGSARRSFVQIVDDVIFIVPNEDSLRRHLIDYAQRRSGSLWEKVGEIYGGKPPLKTRLKNLIRKIVRP